MIKSIYQKAFNILKKKPLHLWGLSLLSAFLSGVATIGFAGLPIVGLAIALVIETGMTMVYLAGYRGEGFETENLFAGFKDKKFGRIAGGMAWMYLWIVIWGMIPIVGPIFAIIKAYQYRFTPYILMTRPEVKVMDAIKVSKAETEGYKSKMFLAELLFGVAIAVVSLVLGLLSAIPFVGVLFVLVLIVVEIAIAAFGPLFLGLIGAAFYDEIQHCNADPTYKAQYEKAAPQPPVYNAPQYAQPAEPQAQAPATFCSNCGTKIEDGAAFCPTCGKKLN